MRFAVSLLLALTLAPAARAADAKAPRVREGAVVDTLPAVEVTDRFERMTTRYLAASQGAVTLERLRLRPVYRVGEMLEAVPGVAISQHSGEGKANQYYLRGFNLDHGTDFASFVAGVPVNLPTHGHGQGYSDLNFVIPELVGGVDYRKGPYFADEGDFSTAGAAHLRYLNTLERPLGEFTWDRFGYRRALVGGSRRMLAGDLLGALDFTRNDGPWTHPENFQKLAGVLRWGRAGDDGALRLTAMGYDGRWRSTDQVPDRAIAGGLIPRYGSIDPTDGGKSHRYSVSGEWQRAMSRGLARATAYVLDYRLNLWSNFTYFLDDTTNGDQFEQADERTVAGLRARWDGERALLGAPADLSAGVDVRQDWIRDVSLHHTLRRARLATTRADRVDQTSVAPWAQSVFRWGEKARTTLGVRLDAYRFDVASDRPENSGAETAFLASPKLGVTLGPWAKTAWFVNAGAGFHSNDARGATIRVDPSSGEAVGRVDPLVRTWGGEVGVRTFAIPGLQSGVSLWALDMDSELLFVGDAGTTEASRPSRRLGVEWSSAWSPGRHLALDADLAWSRARFRDPAPEGDRIPGAVEGVASLGLEARQVGRFDAGLRYRWFGPRPLIEDNSIRSRAAHSVSAQLGCRVLPGLRATVEAFNLFDRRFSDIDYYYDSRLPGESAAGVADIHTHPAAPRTIRLAVTATTW